jgi:hypothetical protein
MVLVRRLLLLLVACLAASVAYTVLQRRRAEQLPEISPVWPPLESGDGHLTSSILASATPTQPSSPSSSASASSASSASSAQPASSASGWVPPALGACPDGYPVKAKQSSQIYHVPGGRFYDRTVPDRCYADPAAAEADGYRASKS